MTPIRNQPHEAALPATVRDAAPRSRATDDETAARDQSEATDEEIAALARQLGDVIDRSSPEDRAVLGEFARDAVFEETEEAINRDDRADRPRKPLGPFAAAALLGVVGAFFLIAFPPAGVVLLLMALVTVVWGVAQQAIGSRRAPEAVAEPRDEEPAGARPDDGDR